MKLLFVCMGNICRSPTAEGVMAGLLRDRGLEGVVSIDSAGTGDWHVGQSPDRRSVAAARSRGIDLDSVARQVTAADLDEFDLVLAADRVNVRALLGLAGADESRRGRVHLLREFDPASVASGDLEVPDPYYGDGDGFERVLDICQAACAGLLDSLETSGALTAS